MHPILFRIGAFELRSYGLLLAVSFLLGIYLAMYRARKQNLDPNPIVDLSVYIIFAAIIGSRFLYVIYHLDEFRGRWLDTISPLQSSGQIGLPGLTMLGGVILATLVSLWYMARKKLPILKYADVLVVSVALGIFITRIGCFLNGCCFGLPCNLPWGVQFPAGSMAGFHFPDTPIHPAQLYESFSGLLMVLLLLFIERRKRFDGELFFWFFVFYGLARFTIDFFRYYENSMVAIRMGEVSISVNQVISLIFVLLGGILLVMRYKKSRFMHKTKKTT